MSGLDEKGLAPCPFCGSGDIITIVDQDITDGRYAACEGCGAEGPSVPTSDGPDDAIAAWNRRASLSAVGQKAGTVEVRALEWQDHRGHTFPDTWTAKTPCGVYEIEERSASDSPAYVATGPLHVFISDRDSLEDAKAAAQADYEARIRSALIPAPSVAEAAEPVAWATVPREPTPEMVGAWYRVKNGHHFHDEPPPTDRSDYAAYRALIAAAPAPSPVPSGLEALRFSLHYDPVEKEPFAHPTADGEYVRYTDYAALIYTDYAALIAERDEAHGMIEIIKKAHGVSIENGNVLRSDLSAALNRIAEIEGETREACAKIAEAEAKAVDGRNADRYWQSKRIAAAIRSSATKQEKADV